MPQFLLEFLSEEIPARMQPRAETDLERLLMEKLAAAGFLPEGVKAFAGPRRLAAVVDGLPVRQADVSEERKGPRVGAPEQAVQGFLKAAGLQSIAQAEIVEDKKGAFYVARVERKGRETAEILAEIVLEIARAFPWPKSMRSQDQDFRWVRPLKQIVCAFDGEAVAIPEAPAPVGRITQGHRFHAPGPIEVRRFEDYAEKLQKAHVLVRREDRKARLLAEARTLCQARNLELVEDPGLAEECAGLAEWPVALMGEMDPDFLDLPPEVIRLTMRAHQRYFAVRDPSSGRLAPNFVLVANIEASDGGQAIAAGNARVLSARLNDARFFWRGDLKLPLDHPTRIEKLSQIVFHQKLGSVWAKVERVAALARQLAPACGADPDLAERAARLAKMDLVTETVGEFPELQGQIGRQIWEETGDDPRLAAAIEDHYRPLGPNDRVPADPVAITVALADKLDTLVGFWSIDEKPTGSSDPYALRRAALGVIRILLANELRFSLDRVNDAQGLRIAIGPVPEQAELDRVLASIVAHGVYGAPTRQMLDALAKTPPSWLSLVVDHDPAVSDSLLEFLHDRLKVHLRDQGARHDLIDAILAMPERCDLALVVKRVEALGSFLKSEDGANLLAGYRRAANILKAEEKKEPGLAEALAAAALDEALLTEPAERALAEALALAEPAARAAVAQERFSDAMAALSRLRPPVDAFFDQVLVNAEDAMVRRNRLLLLFRMRSALAAVADFSKIEG